VFLPDFSDGFHADVSITSPWNGEQVEPLFSKFNNSAFNFYIDGVPKSVPVRGYVSVSGLV
jgi:beta-glucosidase